jgi:hypothetical protein
MVSSEETRAAEKEMRPMTKLRFKSLTISIGFTLLLLIIRNTGNAPAWLLVALGLFVMWMTFDVSAQIREFEDRLTLLEDIIRRNKK